MKISIQQMSEAVERRAIKFMEDEVNISISSKNSKTSSQKKISLTQYTAIVNVDCGQNMPIVFSLEKSVAIEIYRRFMEEEEPDSDPKQQQDDLEDITTEIVNIIIGNTITDLDKKTITINFSPPMMIPKATKISYRESVDLITYELVTGYGKIFIYFIKTNQDHLE